MLESGLSLALWRSACRGRVVLLGHGALPILRHGLRYCPYAPPVSGLPSTGRGVGAPRWTAALSAAACPCRFTSHLARPHDARRFHLSHLPPLRGLRSCSLLGVIVRVIPDAASAAGDATDLK